MSEPYEVALRRRATEARALPGMTYVTPPGGPAIPSYVLLTIGEAERLADVVEAARRLVGGLGTVPLGRALDKLDEGAGRG